MRALRPLLYGYQGLGAGRVLKPARHSELPGVVFACKSQCRARHDNGSPHKEYFQIPGQEPKPDLTPYERTSQQVTALQPLQPHASSQRHGQSHTADEQQTQPKETGWLRIPRVIRSLIWVSLFLQLGLAAGTALVTWEYLSPAFEPGSPEDQELVENILETLEDHPVVQDLRKRQWIEVEPFTPDLSHGAKGRHMVHHVLGGNSTQGIFMKVFHHPGQEFTMLVFFFGFGVEGWPDVVHGGILSTVMHEGLDKHVEHYYPNFSMVPGYKTVVDFVKPCQPGEIYAVLLEPPNNRRVTAGNVPLTELEVTARLCQIVGAPIVSTTFNFETNTETHRLLIAATEQNPTNATFHAVVRLVAKKIGLDGSMFRVGKQDDAAFGRALDYLKTRPEFKGPIPPPPAESTDEEREDKG